MSCYKYWGKIEEIADKLSNYGDLDNEGLSALDGTDIDEITMILDEIEVIAHDKEIDFVIRDDFRIKQLIQVSYTLTNAKTEKREVDALVEAAGELHCSDLVIVTANEEREIEKNGYIIKVIPIYKM